MLPGIVGASAVLGFRARFFFFLVCFFVRPAHVCVSGACFSAKDNRDRLPQVHGMTINTKRPPSGMKAIFLY